jgi:hypothetical protein
MQPFNRATFPGQYVTLQRSDSSPTDYVAIGWEQGLPIACKPVSLKEIESILSRHPAHLT